MAQLLRPELFKKRHWLGAKPDHVAKVLLRHATEAQKRRPFEPAIAVLIRTKNDEQGLRLLLNYVDDARKNYAGRIDVVVVDTESHDKTPAIAKAFGAKLVTISQADFNYPKGLNIGLKVVKPDVLATFITVGHAMPVLKDCLKAGAWHFKDHAVAGVYASVLPNANASFWESLYWNEGQLRLSAHPIAQVTMGTMGATNCMIRMQAWRSKPFDELYAMGGEDNAWARWALQQGYKIIFEPLMSVHHSHGLGVINLLKQYRHWRQVNRHALAFNQNEIKNRRPDLFNK